MKVAIGWNRQTGLAAAAPFILPGLILVCAFVLYPLGKNVLISFSDYDLMTGSLTLTGIDHYRDLFESTQGRFWYAYRNNVLYAVVTTPFTTILGLLAAVMINSLRRGGTFFRTTYYLPVVTSWIIIGLVFMYLFNPGKQGLVNYTLVYLLRILPKPLNWLRDEWRGSFVIWCLGIFKGIGFPMVVFLAALQAIPRDLYEAAELEGCRFFRRIASITAPLIRPTMYFLVVQSVIGSFNVFLQVLILTKGEPSGRTEVLQHLMFTRTFELREFAQGAAIGVMTALSVAVFSLLLNRLVTSDEYRWRGARS